LLITVDDGTGVTNVAASKTKIFCNAGDNICVNGDLILPAHLIYGEDATAAAAFAIS
jgi:cutinase